MRREWVQLVDGSTFQDAIRACGALYAASQVPAEVGRNVAKRSIDPLMTAFVFSAESRYASWGFEAPKFPSFVARLKWWRNPYLSGNTRFDHLLEICGQEAIQHADDLDDLNIRMFWGNGCDPPFRTPDLISPCRDCRRLFFHSDSRRMICNDCQRKNERSKKRQQRGTDLSERTCPACSSKFTPKRSHAVCCSARCRAALSRKAKGIKEHLPG